MERNTQRPVRKQALVPTSTTTGSGSKLRGLLAVTALTLGACRSTIQPEVHSPDPQCKYQVDTTLWPDRGTDGTDDTNTTIWPDEGAQKDFLTVIDSQATDVQLLDPIMGALLIQQPVSIRITNIGGDGTECPDGEAFIVIGSQIATYDLNPLEYKIQNTFDEYIYPPIEESYEGTTVQLRTGATGNHFGTTQITHIRIEPITFIPTGPLAEIFHIENGTELYDETCTDPKLNDNPYCSAITELFLEYSIDAINLDPYSATTNEDFAYWFYNSTLYSEFVDDWLSEKEDQTANPCQDLDEYTPMQFLNWLSHTHHCTPDEFVSVASLYGKGGIYNSQTP